MSLPTRRLLLRGVGVATGLVGWLLVGDYALTNYPRGKREFKRESVEATLMEALNTGDIMLFTRNSKQLHPFKLLSIYLAKKQGPFDHVGVIIRNDQEELPYVLEYTFQGPKMTPYDQRVLLSSETDISIRHVHIAPPNDVKARKDLEAWAEGVMQKKENIGYLKLLSDQFRAARYTGPSRPAVLGEVMHLEDRLRQEKDETKRQALTNLLTMAKSSWDVIKSRQEKPRGSPAAELVAVAMQRLSALPLMIPASEYVPEDFARDLPCPPDTVSSDLVAVLQKGRPRPKYDKPW